MDGEKLVVLNVPKSQEEPLHVFADDRAIFTDYDLSLAVVYRLQTSVAGIFRREALVSCLSRCWIPRKITLHWLRYK